MNHLFESVSILFAYSAKASSSSRSDSTSAMRPERVFSLFGETSPSADFVVAERRLPSVREVAWPPFSFFLLPLLLLALFSSFSIAASLASSLAARSATTSISFPLTVRFCRGAFLRFRVPPLHRHGATASSSVHLWHPSLLPVAPFHRRQIARHRRCRLRFIQSVQVLERQPALTRF